MRVLGILDHESAMNYINVPIMSVNIYPSLPSGTSKNYQTYQYLKLRHSNGETGCIAIEWIDKGTFEIHEGVDIEFKIEDAKVADVDRIREILAFNGFDAVSFTMS